MGEIETDWVRSKQGVGQGSLLSSLRFSLYTDELAARIRKGRWGFERGLMKYGWGKQGILIYADVIVLLAK